MSNIVLPKIDQSIIERKKYIFNKLKKLTAPENVLSHEAEIKPYETDALTAYKQIPLGVILPENTEEVSRILKFCYQENIKVVPRGAGTGLSGGALPLQDAILISLTKFNKILEIQNITKLPLVLHGSSGISHNIRKKVARMTNVAKFNIGTELRMVGCKSLRKSYNKNINNFDKINIIKSSILELKKATIKVIKNIGPINAKK